MATGKGRATRNTSANGRASQRSTQTRPRPEDATAYFDKQPPFDLEAEIGTLGSMVLYAPAIDEVSMILSAEDFYDFAHQILFRHIVSLHEHGRQFDTTLLLSRLDASGELDQVGKAAYLSKIINAVPNAAHARYYAEIVKEKAIYRKLIIASTETLRDAYDQSAPAADLVGQAETAIASVSDSTIRGGDSRPFNEIITASMAQLDDRINGIRPRLLHTGLEAFHDCMGLTNGGLTIIGGRPSNGKTSACVRIAGNVAQDGHVVYFASLEMTAMELADRMLSGQTRVEYSRMLRGSIGCEQRDRLVEASSRMAHWRLFIDDSPSMSLSHIGAAARRVKRRHDALHLVVIDYAQLIDPENKRATRVEQLGEISRGLKRLARELQCPVICCAQVNRDAEENADKRPRLHQLKGAGDFEQDADTVVFVHRPKWYLKAEEQNRDYTQAEDAELIVAKNRNGPTRIFEALWWGAWMDWGNKASATQEHRAEGF